MAILSIITDWPSCDKCGYKGNRPKLYVYDSEVNDNTKLEAELGCIACLLGQENAAKLQRYFNKFATK